MLLKVSTVSIFDDKLTFNAHIDNVCQRAVKLHSQLSRAARVSWGLKANVSKMIYNAAVEPTITYAACAWADSARKLGARKQLNAIQRGFAQKACYAYRTVSLHSALAISGILPLDLRIREAANLYLARKGKAENIIRDLEITV